MKLFLFFAGIVISLNNYHVPTVAQENCSFSPAIYQSVFPGTVKVLYNVTIPNLTLDCTYFVFGQLNSDNKTASMYFSFRINNNYYVEYSEDEISENGLTSDNNTYYVGSISQNQVITINECPGYYYLIGCHVDNCGSEVIASAKKEAQKLANSKNKTVHTVNQTDCIYKPS